MSWGGSNSILEVAGPVFGECWCNFGFDCEAELLENLQSHETGGLGSPSLDVGAKLRLDFQLLASVWTDQQRMPLCFFGYKAITFIIIHHGHPTHA